MAISQKMLAFAERSSWIRKMFEEGARLKAQYGADQVCDFSLGNPDLPPPAQYKEAVQKVTATEGPGAHGYMANNGYPFVREAVAKQIGAEQGMAVSQDDILMTVGAAGGLNVTMKALLDPGDEVIILAPFFVEYNFYVDNHGGVTKIVNTAVDFSLDLPAIGAAITPKTKAIIINSPNNPTGQIYSAAELAGLAEVLARAAQTIYLISDEPYRKIVYDNLVVPSIFKAYQNSLIVSSYSKDLSLPGERIGYIAVHPEIEGKSQLLGAMTLANRILGFVNAPALMQRVVAELQGITVDCTVYARRRELFCKVLSEAGYEFVPPKGAFYMFPKSPIGDDAKFVGLLAEEKILGVPGRGFGMEGYFRLAFCVEDAVISRSAEGFKRALAKALA
ncbi:MAG: pyridoxal phosphate-dependent aminotransferase [Proteobacteria bacterium]|jgi:aspartate aminotransferase|nr:pyridoxal phosphate-dependent aminotransferase [Pseudomonadota bacterium]MCG2823108.1 pyridoxal phosphate-dependent aminotransferase [Desulfobulbaceae bacterium]MDP2001810.1 pyridoxal phosphate-dependent aminotransferase [Desulfurivibrionaceae bacterium]PKN22941.1 MAG: aspartate aminotransferase [Deltaproteobacteria bacterium HGW-Deltaproteobacteria-3]